MSDHHSRSAEHERPRPSSPRYKIAPFCRTCNRRDAALDSDGRCAFCGNDPKASELAAVTA